MSNFFAQVRYQSRKRLAEQRPRVRGQFVRQVQNETPVGDADGPKIWRYKPAFPTDLEIDSWSKHETIQFSVASIFNKFFESKSRIMS